MTDHPPAVETLEICASAKIAFIDDMGSLPLDAVASIGLEEAEAADVELDEPEAAEVGVAPNSDKSWFADRPP